MTCVQHPIALGQLLPLPVEPFRYYQYGERTVHLDGCVEVDAAYYGAPPGWIGRRVQVQWDARQVRLLDPHTGQLLREHLHQTRGRHRIQDEDRPQKTPLGTMQLLARADRSGSQIGTLCREMHREHGEIAVRRIQGVLSLAKKYGVASVDDACAAALEMGVTEDPAEFERRMHDLVVQLGSSHTAFYHRNLRPAPARQAICATIQECGTDNGRMWLFQAVQEGGPAYEAGVRDGDLLVSVGDGEVRPSATPLFKVGTDVSLRVRKPDGSERGIKVSIPMPDKPSQPFVQPKPVVYSKLDSRVGLLKVNIFPGIVGIDFAREIDKAVAYFGHCRALIIDLRGNSGGGMGGLRLMSYLTPDRLPIGYSLTRSRAQKGYRREELRQFDRIPRRKAALLWLALRYGLGDQSIALFTEGLGPQSFQGRVAILVNANTASASEIVAAFASEKGLARIVGTRTAGRLVASKRFKLAGGYFLSLPVGAYLTWEGKMLEKAGIEPDVPVEVTYEDVLTGRDAQLEAALQCVNAA